MVTRFHGGAGIMPLVVLVVLVVLAAAAALVATVVWFGAHGDRARAGAPAPTGSSTATVSGSASEQLAPTTAPKGGVELPRGGGRVDGYPVEFPYTDLGAVAVQAQVATAQVGFDYEQAGAVADIYAAPDDRALFERRSGAAVRLRREQAGLSGLGDVPPPASYAVTPVAFTVDELDTDYYVVNLLSYVTLTTAKGKVSDFLYAGTQLVRWTDGDWKLVRGTPTEYRRLIDDGQPPAAAPGTPGFDRAGWIPISAELR